MEVKSRVLKDGSVYYFYRKFDRDVLHRDYDKPALISSDGSRRYYRHGKLHRESGPAIEYSDGSVAYLVEGRYHREGVPAIIEATGSSHYYVAGKRHRKDGPAIEYANGGFEYWINGVLHNETGPAKRLIHENGVLEEYRIWNLVHRVGAPAKIFPDRREYLWFGRLHRYDGFAVESAEPLYALHGKILDSDAFLGLTASGDPATISLALLGEVRGDRPTVLHIGRCLKHLGAVEALFHVKRVYGLVF